MAPVHAGTSAVARRAWHGLLGRLLALALVASALAPTLSHALADAAADHSIPVCTVEGLRWLDPDTGKLKIPASTQHVLEHCPYCSLHLPALPAAPAASVAAAPEGVELESPSPAPPIAKVPHRRALPRAPPALS